MISYQSIELRIKEVTDKTKDLAFMNKEQIFDMVAQIVAISDDLSTYIRQLDIKISEEEGKVLEKAQKYKMNASMARILLKQVTSSLNTDKDWANRQIQLLSEIRMAALAAQRSAE